MAEKLPMPVRFHQRMPEELARALDQAARQRFTTRSEYARTAIMDRLRSDGIQLDSGQLASA